MKLRYILLICAILVGIFYSYYKEIYHEYVNFYYHRIKKETLDTSIKKSEKLFKDGRYDDLKKYTGDLLELYPTNIKIKRITGLAYIKTGEPEKGARFLLDTISDSKKDSDLFLKSINILFENKWYSDVAIYLSDYPIANSASLNYMYGISLIKTNRHNEGLRYLIKSERLGASNYEIYFNMGMVNEKNGNLKEAISNYEDALRKNPLEIEAKESLVRVYTKARMYKKAERLLRKR